MPKSLMFPAPGVSTRSSSVPVLAKGFRVFFLLAAVYAVVVVPVWLLVAGGAVGSIGSFSPAYWHAHEMLFGFTTAVVAGFLLTAVSNWTKRETAVGARLAGLAALWVAGRVVVSLGPLLPRGLVAAVDVAFLPALALTIAKPLIATGNRRNLVMVGVLAALSLANAAMHADALGIMPGTSHRGALVAVDLIVLLIVVISGRVFPMFTRNATGVADVAGRPRLDVVAIAATALVAVVDMIAPGERLWTAGAVLFAAAATGVRATTWGARHTARQPLLWVLHAGYAFVPAGFLLRALPALNPSIPLSPALHSFTLGAIGTLTLGMMARVSLGHTGRMLAVDRMTAYAFGAVVIAAIVRVVAPLTVSAAYWPSITVAGLLWTAAFAIYLVRYAPILTAPRVDGLPG